MEKRCEILQSEIVKDVELRVGNCKKYEIYDVGLYKM
jgi:hypothetical protein